MRVSMIFDLFLLAVLLLSAFYYSRKGFVAGIVHFVGSLVSLVGAWIASSKISPAVFENFFKTGLVNKTRELLESQSDINLEMLVERFAGFLPESIKNNILQSVSGMLDTTTPDAALTIVEKVVAPLLVPIISVVVFFVTFALCRLVVSLLTAMLTNINRVPLLGGVNRLLGFIAGLGAGGINVLLLLCAVWAVGIILGQQSPFISEELLGNSLFYKLLAPYNPFL